MDNATCYALNANLVDEFRRNESLFCPPVFDKYLCWPPTIANSNSTQNCPHGKGLDSTKFAWRTCNDDGTWFNNNRSNLVDLGYTEYRNCFKPLTLMLQKLYDSMGVEKCLSIVEITRIIEMIGYSLSLVTLLASLAIFYKYRVLRNNRTTIHKNLFIAMLLQVVVRLIIYTDQPYEKIETISYLCETFLVILEFSKTATIMWMFIEGLSLHNAMTITVFQEYSFIKFYCYAGWLASILLTTIWVASMAYVETEKCWYMYNFQTNYWILEGPTSALIVINMVFLLNIIRILVMKLRDSNMGEIEQIRKAVRAAIVLVPLMGSVNILFMIDFRTLQTAWKFALWSYTTYFFMSFQGFFIATLYCFMNGEVRDVVRNNFSLYMSLRHCGGSVVTANHSNNNQRNHRRNSSEVTRLSSADPEV